MFKPFFLSKKYALWAWGGLLLLIIIIYIIVTQSVALNEWTGNFYSAIQNPDKVYGVERFKYLLVEFGYIIAVLITLSVVQDFLTSHYTFRWRQAISDNYISKWQNINILVEGASQRIQEDCMRFARLTEKLGIGFLGSILTLSFFVPILWHFSDKIHFDWLNVSGSLVIISIIIALGGTIISWLVGIRLPKLEYDIQKTEAAFRKELVYLEDKKFSVNISALTRLFINVRAKHFIIFRHYAYFGFWKYSYDNISFVLPLLLMAPSLFSGTISLGVAMQINGAMLAVTASLSYFIRNWTEVTELRSIYKRLKEFDKSITE